MQHKKIEKAADGIATLVLDNAVESMNLISTAFVEELEQAVADLSADPAVSAVILKSAKPAFLAGADLKQMVQAFGRMTMHDAYALSQRTSRLYRAIETSGKPWAALINGLALGGGFELALACHYRIMDNSPAAMVGLPEVNLGLLPGAGGTQRMIRVAGVNAGSELLLFGRQVKGADALALGIVDELASVTDMEARARAWLATKPSPVKPWDQPGYALPEQKGLILPEFAGRLMVANAAIAKVGYHYPAPRAILSCIYEGVQLPFDKALDIESQYFAQLLTDPVARNIIRTTFLSKGAAERGARRPQGIEKATFGKVGVLGAGMMGAGIALVCAQAGCDVILIDRDVAAAEKGKAYSEGVFAKQVAKGKKTQEQAAAMLARIQPTDDFARLDGCDLVIEAVFEDIAVKADATRKAEAAMPESALFASNTSTLPISLLAEASARPDQFIGLHFFSPVERMVLVEVIKGKKTSPAALAKALDFVAKLKKTPIVVNDSRGFYTSRVFQKLVLEGAAMLEEGIAPALIENTARGLGFPVGPLALLDELTLDLPLKIVEQAIAQEGPGYVVPAGVDAIRKMKEQGRSGKKSGSGFYDYPEGGEKHLWPGLADLFGSQADQDAERLKQRFLFAQALESARCLEEQVIETPADGDLGGVFGWGFPAWTGGPLSYIDTLGIARFVREADELAALYGPRFAPSAWLRARAERQEDFYPAPDAR